MEKIGARTTLKRVEELAGLRFIPHVKEVQGPSPRVLAEVSTWWK